MSQNLTTAASIASLDIHADAASFGRHLRASNLSPRTVQSYLEAVDLFTRYLIEHSRQRHQQTLERARRALVELADTGQSVTVAELASRAGVSRSWIYTQPELREQIQQHQRSHSDSDTARQKVTRASDESLHRRLTLAHERITQLRKENQQLREALAHACGQLRAARAPAR